MKDLIEYEIGDLITYYEQYDCSSVKAWEGTVIAQEPTGSLYFDKQDYLVVIKRFGDGKIMRHHRSDRRLVKEE